VFWLISSGFSLIRHRIRKFPLDDKPLILRRAITGNSKSRKPFSDGCVEAGLLKKVRNQKLAGV
jgi:hypothetical protein